MLLLVRSDDAAAGRRAPRRVCVRRRIGSTRLRHGGGQAARHERDHVFIGNLREQLQKEPALGLRHGAGQAARHGLKTVRARGCRGRRPCARATAPAPPPARRCVPAPMLACVRALRVHACVC